MLASPASAQVAERTYYNPYTGNSTKVAGAYNPYTGKDDVAYRTTAPGGVDAARGAAYNPYTGSYHGGTAATNPSTGTREESKTYYNPTTGRVDHVQGASTRTREDTPSTGAPTGANEDTEWKFSANAITAEECVIVGRRVLNGTPSSIRNRMPPGPLLR
jgi:hypothetical protein